MIIVFKAGTEREKVDFIAAKVTEFGYEPRVIRGVERTVIAAVGDEVAHRSLEDLQGYPYIENVMPVQKRYKLASREFHPGNSILTIGEHKIGAGNFMIIAGPCSVESREQMRRACRDLVAAGVGVLRAGAYKPRTSPYDFQGLGDEGLAILGEMKAEFGLPVVTEALGPSQVDKIAKVADVIQIGARNCQNYYLLEKAAGVGLAVLLKRGMATRIDEWLLAAEYLLVHGCPNVILCERGIRTYETATRFTLDLGAVAVAKRETHLPVVVDPSHAAGHRSLVLPLAKAGIAAGADGLLIETHPEPAEARSDNAQQLPSAELGQALASLKPLIDVCRQGPNP